MRIHSPSLVELHAFLAVVRTGNFRKAAEALCVTQGAISRAVLRLEASLGQAVLHRSTTGVVPTPVGQELRRLAEKPIADLESAAQLLRHRPDRQRLRLSVITSISNLWLMPRLEGFRREHPDIELELRRYHHDEDLTQRDDVDLWIVVRRSATHRWSRQISAQYLIGKEIVAVCTPETAQRVTTPESLFSLPLLYHSGYPDNWAVWAQAAGVTMPERWNGTGIDLVVNVVEAARAGMGVAVVQKCMIEADLRSGRLVMPFDTVASTGRGYYMCRRRAQDGHLAADLFSRWALAQAKKTD